MIQDSILVCSPDPRIPHTACGGGANSDLDRDDGGMYEAVCDGCTSSLVDHKRCMMVKMSKKALSLCERERGEDVSWLELW
jgi:hypothetical protein